MLGSVSDRYIRILLCILQVGFKTLINIKNLSDVRDAFVLLFPPYIQYWKFKDLEKPAHIPPTRFQAALLLSQFKQVAQDSVETIQHYCRPFCMTTATSGSSAGTPAQLT